MPAAVASDSAPCAKCGSPQCLALVRSTEAPKDWKDLLDRFLMLVSSGHWSWRTTGQVIALAAVGSGLLCVVLGNKLPAAGHELIAGAHLVSASPTRWIPALGVSTVAAAGLVWRRWSGRRHVPDAGDAAEPGWPRDTRTDNPLLGTAREPAAGTGAQPDDDGDTSAGAAE